MFTFGITKKFFFSCLLFAFEYFCAACMYALCSQDIAVASSVCVRSVFVQSAKMMKRYSSFIHSHTLPSRVRGKIFPLRHFHMQGTLGRKCKITWKNVKYFNHLYRHLSVDFPGIHKEVNTLHAATAQTATVLHFHMKHASCFGKCWTTAG